MTTTVERAITWAEMLRAALERRDFAAAGSYARHIADMTDELRRSDLAKGDQRRARPIRLSGIPEAGAQPHTSPARTGGAARTLDGEGAA